ncbi:MAG TPA: homocysteine S-methyltransferase family protein [candidate division Zixibacteria bacterium]|nr:homocysteine S-methyltransferase family protein [candidate division Zixibacteria bacterium]
MSPYDAIRQKIAGQRVVILDGGVGTEILRRNVSWADHQVTRLPEVIRSIHEDYIGAGADVITTNTFQLSRRSFLNHFKDTGHMRHIGARDLESRADKLLRAAVALAVEARRRRGADRTVAVAGSVTTLEWCFRPDLAPPAEQARGEYEEIIRTMAESGVDLILLETLNGVAEAEVALRVVRAAGLPAWVSFVCDEKGRLFSGETLAQAVAALEPLEPDVILLNCAPPDDITAGLRELTACRSGPTGAFAHIGRFDPPEWLFTDEYPPAGYLECARRWRDMGARVIGGCCGTTPAHIEELRKHLS